MPVLDPLQIVAKVTGEQEIARLTKEIEKETAAIENLNNQFKAGAIGQAQFELRAKLSATQIQSFTADIKNVEAGMIQMGAGSSKAAMGLLHLGYIVDDIQYGFKAVVNNIPQLVMGFGGGMGLAGAIGIVGVAVSQLINHWDEISGKLGNTAIWMTAKGALIEFDEAVKEGNATLSNLETLLEILPGVYGPLMGIWRELASMPESAGAKIEAAQAARKEAAQKASGQGAILGQVEEDTAETFHKAVRAYGGSDKLIKDTVEAIMKATPGTDRDMAKVRAQEMLGKGLKGEAKNLDFFAGGFRKEFEDEVNRKEEKRTTDIETARAALTDKQEKAKLKQIEDWAKDEHRVAKEEFDKKKKFQIEGIEGAQENLGLKQKIMRRDLKDTRESQVFTGTHAFASSMMTGGLESVAKSQLKELEKLNVKQDELARHLKAVRGMQFVDK